MISCGLVPGQSGTAGGHQWWLSLDCCAPTILSSESYVYKRPSLRHTPVGQQHLLEPSRIGAKRTNRLPSRRLLSS